MATELLVKELIRYPKIDPQHKCYEVIVTIRHSFNGWKGDILSVDRDYIICVQGMAHGYYQWTIRTEAGYWLSGTWTDYRKPYATIGSAFRRAVSTLAIVTGVLIQ